MVTAATDVAKVTASDSEAIQVVLRNCSVVTRLVIVIVDVDVFVGQLR